MAEISSACARIERSVLAEGNFGIRKCVATTDPDPKIPNAIPLHLTGANVSNFTEAEALLRHVPENGVLHGGKGYDSYRIRWIVEALGSLPNIPPAQDTKIEKLFLTIHLQGQKHHRVHLRKAKGIPQGATLYDRNAENFQSSICLAATIYYWL